MFVLSSNSCLIINTQFPLVLHSHNVDFHSKNSQSGIFKMQQMRRKKGGFFMSIFERVGDLIKSNVNDLLDRAEDPEKMVKQMVVDMEKQFQKATQETGTATGGLNRLKKQLEEAKKQSENWNTKAKACLSQGDAVLAKRALENKVMQDKLVTQYQGMYDSMEKQVEELKNQTMQLKQKLEIRLPQSH